MAANNVTVRMSAEEAGMVQAWREARRGVAEFSQELDKAGQKGNAAGKKVKDGFSGVGSDLMGYAAGLVTVSAAIGKVTAAWTDYIKAQQDAAKSMRATLDSSSKLSQLASTPQELQKLHDKRDYLTGKFGITTGQAVDAIFNARSAGLDDSGLEMLAKGSIIGDDPAQAAAFMGSIQQIYKGKVDPLASYNVALQGAADSPKLEMKHYTKALPAMMAPGDKLGLGITDLASMMTEGSATFGEETGTRYQELLGRLGTFEEFQGQGWAGLERFSALSKKQQEKYIGEDATKRQTADNLKQELEDMRAGSKRLQQAYDETGTDTDAINRQLGIHFDPSTEAGRGNIAKHEAVAAEARAQRAEEKRFGVKELDKDTVMAQERERIANNGTGFIGRAAAEVRRQAAYWTLQDAEEIRYQSQVGENFGSLEGIDRNARATLNTVQERFGVAPSFPEINHRTVTGEPVDNRSVVDEIRGLREDLKAAKDQPQRVKFDGDPSRLPAGAAPGFRDSGGDF